MNDNQAQKNQQKNTKPEQGIVFFFVAMGVIALTYGFFMLIDFLPEKPAVLEETDQRVSPRTDSTKSTDAVNVALDSKPLRIIFDSLERQVPVLNPEDSSVEALDDALLSGVVRHPDSADFENTGTIFLLGHASYLPNVRNKNFQAFNGIQKLEWGDMIRLQSNDTEYVYSVDRVYEVKASDAMIPLERGVAKLTLVTCNSFGSKDDRYIVEATLVGSHPIGQKIEA